MEGTREPPLKLKLFSSYYRIGRVLDLARKGVGRKKYLNYLINTTYNISL
jgi:hypothetical protein